MPVIALTAFYETYPRSSEYDAWLQKPVRLDDLAATIKRLTNR
jgi:hypothetical protein